MIFLNKRSKTAVLVSIILAMLVASMDTTITNTTMPVVADDLGGMRLFAWTFATYMIFSTVMTPLAGRISDLYGRKRIFGIGIIIFTLGSLLCGMSASMLQLVIFRAIQGLGAGLMLPFPSIIASDLFPLAQRGKIQAAFNAMWGIAAIVAPVLGGLFTEYASWRWIFYINLPIGLVALLFLQWYQEPYEAKRARVDVGGAVLFSFSITLLLSLTVVESYIAAIAIAGTVFTVAFIWWERRVSAPLIPINLVKDRTLALFIGNAFLNSCAFFGVSSFIPLVLQEKGYSVITSGLPLVAMSIGWIAVGGPSGTWILRWGYRPLMLIGSAVLLVSGVMLVFIGEATSFAYIMFPMVLQGVSFGLLVTVSILSVQQLVPNDQRGVATSVLMFARNTGTAICVTVMGALLYGADLFYTGVRNLFIYGIVLAALALVAAWMIPRSEGSMLDGEGEDTPSS